MEKRVFPCVIPLAEPITKCFTTHRHADSPQGLDDMNQLETVCTIESAEMVEFLLHVSEI